MFITYISKDKISVKLTYCDKYCDINNIHYLDNS